MASPYFPEDLGETEATGCVRRGCASLGESAHDDVIQFVEQFGIYPPDQVFEIAMILWFCLAIEAMHGTRICMLRETEPVRELGKQWLGTCRLRDGEAVPKPDTAWLRAFTWLRAVSHHGGED